MIRFAVLCDRGVLWVLKKVLEKFSELREKVQVDRFCPYFFMLSVEFVDS